MFESHCLLPPLRAFQEFIITILDSIKSRMADDLPVCGTNRWSWLAANNQLSSESQFVINNSDSLSGGAIAGIVIFVLLMVAVIAFVVYKYAFKKGHHYGVHENTIIGAMDHNPTFSLPKVSIWILVTTFA